MAPTQSRGVLQFFGVACLIIAALFVILSIPFFWGQMKVLRSWPVRQAQIISSKVVTLPTAKHDQLYAARIEIVYVVNDRPVTSVLTNFESSNFEETARQATQFPVGSRRAIRYNPDDPSDSRIGASWNRRFFAVPLITFGIGAAFAAIATVLLAAGRAARPAVES